MTAFASINRRSRRLAASLASTLLLMASCADDEPPTPASPVGQYAVVDVEDAVARVFARQNARVDEVLRALGANATASDEKVGRDEAIRIRDDLTRRLREARIDLMPDSRWTWSPAPDVVAVAKAPDTMSGRWRTDGARIELEVSRFGPVDVPWRVALSGTRSGRQLLLDEIVGAPLENNGFTRVVLGKE